MLRSSIISVGSRRGRCLQLRFSSDYGGTRPSVTDLPSSSTQTGSPPEASVGLARRNAACSKEAKPAVRSQECFSRFLDRRLLGRETTIRLRARTARIRTYFNEVRTHMEQLLDIFTQRVNRDEKILSFAEGRRVTVRYELTDIKISFYTAFDQGAVRCGVGEVAGQAASHFENEG